MTEESTRLSRSLKLTAGYFILLGVVGIVWLLLDLGPASAEFEAKSLAYRIGAYSRVTLVNIAFLVTGASILRRRSWVPTASYVTLAIATIYDGYQFAWGFSGGQPGGLAIAGSLGAVAVWNCLWAFFVYRNRAAFVGSRGVQCAAA